MSFHDTMTLKSGCYSWDLNPGLKVVGAEEFTELLRHSWQCSCFLTLVDNSLNPSNGSLGNRTFIYLYTTYCPVRTNLVLSRRNFSFAYRYSTLIQNASANEATYIYFLFAHKKHYYRSRIDKKQFLDFIFDENVCNQNCIVSSSEQKLLSRHKGALLCLRSHSIFSHNIFFKKITILDC